MKEQSEDIRINPEEEVSNLMKLSSLLFELSHPWRLKVLLLIAEEGQRHSYIAQKLEISPQETTRHLSRLQDAKLIEKEFHKWCEDLFLYYWERARPEREF